MSLRMTDPAFRWCAGLNLFALAVLILGQTSGLLLLVGLALALSVVTLVNTPDQLTLATLLFWLPWASVMKFSPESFSVLTLSLIILLIKLSIFRTGFLHNVPLVAGVAMAAWVVAVRLFRHEGVDLSFLSLVALLVLVPSYAKSLRSKTSLSMAGVALGVGVVTASVVATTVAVGSRLGQFVVVSEEMRGDVVRLSGFVGDPNYYSAQALVAVGLMMSGWLHGESGIGRARWLLIGGLVFYGATSVSKSFLISLGVVAAYCLLYVPLRMGRRGVALVIGVTLAIAVMLSTTQVLQRAGWMYASRFSQVVDFDSLTTSRGTIQNQYLSYFDSHWEVLFFGQGLSAEYPFGYASHNTLIQAVYLFGILGCLLLLFWVIAFGWRPMANILDAAPAALCILLPWMGLDVIQRLDFYLFIVCLALACTTRRSIDPPAKEVGV